MSELSDSSLLTALKGLGGPVLAAAVGLAWRRSEELRHGKRLTWRAVFLDVPCAIGMGCSVGGITLWFDAPLVAAMGVSGLIGHLGTDWLLRELLPRLIERYLPAKAPDLPAPIPESPKE